MNNNQGTHTWRQQPASYLKPGACKACWGWPGHDNTPATNVTIKEMKADGSIVKIVFPEQKQMLKVGNLDSFYGQAGGCDASGSVQYRVYVRADQTTRFSAVLGPKNGVPLRSYSFQRVKPAAAAVNATGVLYNALMISECKKLGMKPVCDNKKYCLNDTNAVYLGQDDFIAYAPSRRQNRKFPAGWSKIRNQWNGACSYTGKSQVGRALCNTPVNTHAWKTPAQYNPGFVCAVTIGLDSSSKMPISSFAANLTGKNGVPARAYTFARVPVPASGKFLAHFKLGNSITYAFAKAHCASNQMRLAYGRELCNKGVPSTPVLAGDHWTPVGDKDDDWVEVGNSNKRNCWSHDGPVLQGLLKTGKYGAPKWGRTATSKPWKDNVFCVLESSAMPASVCSATRLSSNHPSTSTEVKNGVCKNGESAKGSLARWGHGPGRQPCV